jgi:hypothetical protein
MGLRKTPYAFNDEEGWDYEESCSLKLADRAEILDYQSGVFAFIYGVGEAKLVYFNLTMPTEFCGMTMVKWSDTFPRRCVCGVMASW